MPIVENSPALVIRTDTALMTMDSVPLIEAPKVVVPPAAIVVCPEQRDLWVEYSRQLADVGIMRTVFLTSQLDLAYRWAERMALQGA